MAAREENEKTDAAGGGEGAEVAEEHVHVVTYAAAIDVAKGVRDGVHPDAGQPPGSQAAAGVAGGGHL